MMQNVIATNIEWYIETDDVIDNIRELSEDELFAYGIDKEIIGNSESLDDYLFNNPVVAVRTANLPSEVEIPADICKKALDEGDLDIITNYLSDTYGFLVGNYSISDDFELKVKVNEKEKIIEKD